MNKPQAIKLFTLLFIITLIFPATFAPLNVRAANSPQKTVQQIEALLQAAQARGQFNGTVLVSDKGQIIYRKALGYADLEKKTPLRIDSVFELASVSKPITACAITMLKERGLLSYDDLLTKYFPELPYPEVTIRQMLTHTAGLPDPEPLFGSQWPNDKPVTIMVFVQRLAEQKTPAYFAAGEKWRYDRTAYFLLAAIIEKVSKRSYGEFLNINIFVPSGMKNSYVINTKLMGNIAHMAYGYTHPLLWSDDYVLMETVPRYSYSKYFGDAAGPMGVYSSVEDLLLWVKALHQGKLIKRKTLEEIYTPVRLNDGSMPSAGGGGGNDVPSYYGLGWFVQNGADGKTIRHTGDWRGYITCLIHNPAKNQTIIVLTNTNDVAAVGVANAIENILNLHPYRLPQQSVGRMLGKAILTNGLEPAVAQYRKLKAGNPDDYNFGNDSELNSLGYALMRKGDKKAAIEVFKLNVEAFPNSWNVYDSLGEAYMADGNNEMAIKNYRKSVELNPQNRDGIEALKKLGIQ
jgi:CubicO group peptidase (beta-lactamase class C family)